MIRYYLAIITIFIMLMLPILALFKPVRSKEVFVKFPETLEIDGNCINAQEVRVAPNRTVIEVTPTQCK